MAKMKAAAMIAKGKIGLIEKDIPEYKNDQVLLKVKNVGICGADLEFFEHGALGAWVLEYPHVLGHEPAGIVEAVGEDVTGLEAGDKVSIEPGIPCWKCEFCRRGDYHLCAQVQFMSVPGVIGAFQEYVAWPANMVYKLPDNMDTVEGALIEPLAVGLNAAKNSDAGFGKSAFIIGCGCIGLCVAMALKAYGVAEIYMSDSMDVRLKKAKELDVTRVFDIQKEDCVEEVMKLTNKRGVDLVYECAGSEAGFDNGIKLLAQGGHICQVGTYVTEYQKVNLNALLFKEGSLSTNFRYRNMYPKAIKAVANGSIPLKKIISHTFKLEELGEALELNINNKNEVSKIVIELD